MVGTQPGIHTESAVDGLDRSSPIPLFVQLRQKMLLEIQSSSPEDRRFPSEAALAERYGVAKMTVRQAIDELVQTGLLVRKRGSGTFVTDAAYVERVTPTLDLDQQLRRSGAGFSVRVISVSIRPPTAEEAAAFGTGPEAAVVELQRLRLMADVPVAFDSRVLPESLSRDIGFDEDKARGSIVHTVNRHIPLVSANWRMAAIRPGRDLAALLMLDEDQPVLERVPEYRDGSGKLVMTGRSVHSTDRLAFEFGLDLDLEDDGAPS